jgi:tetratricopeptide (TPR) repeat protein
LAPNADAPTSGRLASSSDDGTQFGEAMGTPAYMSPEQAAGSWDQVGPASDIYSLGATLYMLLTGEPPFEETPGMMLVTVVMDGLQRTPRERRADVPKALEAICLKAMAKRMEDRYSSAQALADDLERWLADEPVIARREGIFERSGRWLRRHRALVLAGLVMGLLLLGCFAIVTALVHGQNAVLDAKNTELDDRNRELHNALEGERKAREDAVAARNRERKALDAAVVARDRARETLEALSSQEALDALARQPALTPQQQSFLKNLVGFYREIAREDVTTPSERTRQATAYFRIAQMLEYLGRSEEGIAAYRQAVAVGQKLIDDFPADSRYRHGMANTQNNLSNLLAKLGRSEESDAALRAALALSEQLVKEYPDQAQFRDDLAKHHHNLAMRLLDQGQLADTEEHIRRALAIHQELANAFPLEPGYQQDLGKHRRILAKLLAQKGERPAAVAEFRQAVDLDERLLARFPGHVDVLHDLSSCLYELANVHVQSGATAEAEEAYRRSNEISEALTRDLPGVPLYRERLSDGLYHLGLLAMNSGKSAEAAAAFTKSKAHRERLAANFPNVRNYRYHLALSWEKLSFAQLNQGQYAESVASQRQALAVREKLAEQFPTDLAYSVEVGGTHCNIGAIYMQQGKLNEAAASFAKAAAKLEEVLAKEPRHATGRQFLANSLRPQAITLARLGRHAEAAKAWTRLLELDDNPKRVDLRIARALSLARAGDYVTAIAEAEDRSVIKNLSAGLYVDLGCIFALAAASVKDDAKLRDQHAARAVELLRQAVAKGYKDAEYLKKVDDLKALRERPDFQSLLKELEKQP